MDVEPEHVLSLVRRPKWARHLLQHERNERVVNTSGAYYHYDAQGKLRVLTGLLPHLSQTYWPHSSYRQMMRGVKRTKVSGIQKGGGQYAGLVRGSCVHKQMHDFVQLDRRHFQKTHKRLHAYAQRLLQVIVGRLKLQPFLAEFDCYDEAMGPHGVGTSVDHIALDAEGRLVLLEFKTGYRDSFSAAQDGFMAGTLHRMPCTPRNQATLQVMGAALILHRRYGIPLEEMRLYVLRIDETVVEVMPVQQEFVQRTADAIYRDLLKETVAEPEQRKVAQ